MSNQEKTWIDEVENALSGVFTTYQNNVKKPICDTLNQIPIQEWSNTYYKPLNKRYQQWPAEFAQFKKNNVLTLGTENQRLILLGLSTLAVVSITKGFSSGLLPIVRNSVVTYFGLGLVVAPEIYNPFLVNRNNNQ